MTTTWDRELYLPKEWAQDTARRVAARVPETVEFSTKPQLAQHMIERAITTQVPFAWLTGDAVYGNDRRLRVWLEHQDLHFELAVASNQHVWPDLTGQKNGGSAGGHGPTARLGQAVGG